MAITDIITPAFVKTNYLYGVSTTDDDDNEFPESLWRTAIDSAVDAAEAEFSIVLRENRKVIKERHDTMSWHADNFFLFTVDNRPIVSVEALDVRFASFTGSSLPLSWAHISSALHGQVQIMAGPEGVEGFSFSGGVPLLALDVLAPREYTPRWLQVTYTAGFEFALTGTVDVTAGSKTVTGTDTKFVDGEQDGVTAGVRPLRKDDYVSINGEIRRVCKVVSDTSIELDRTLPAAVVGGSMVLLAYPHTLIDWISMVSAMLPLDTAGDLIIGAGISNFSIAMDGISQSIGTTAGVENSGYGSRIIQYKNRIKEVLNPAIKRKFKTIRSFFV